jgi:hypothetical protein
MSSSCSVPCVNLLLATCFAGCFLAAFASLANSRSNNVQVLAVGQRSQKAINQRPLTKTPALCPRFQNRRSRSKSLRDRTYPFPLASSLRTSSALMSRSKYMWTRENRAPMTGPHDLRKRRKAPVSNNRSDQARVSIPSSPKEGF